MQCAQQNRTSPETDHALLSVRIDSYAATTSRKLRRGPHLVHPNKASGHVPDPRRLTAVCLHPHYRVRSRLHRAESSCDARLPRLPGRRPHASGHRGDSRDRRAVQGCFESGGIGWSAHRARCRRYIPSSFLHRVHARLPELSAFTWNTQTCQRRLPLSSMPLHRPQKRRSRRSHGLTACEVPPSSRWTSQLVPHLKLVRSAASHQREQPLTRLQIGSKFDVTPLIASAILAFGLPRPGLLQALARHPCPVSLADIGLHPSIWDRVGVEDYDVAMWGAETLLDIELSGSQ